jgi:N-glycosylase/DNA lyase
MSPASPSTSATAWSPAPVNWSPTADVLRETLDGGQAFRWYPLSGDAWSGCWSTHQLALRATPAGLTWTGGDGRALQRYLAADVDWGALTGALPWRSDPHLARGLAAFPGLRILRQPFGETLLGFLCSATKQIVQIKQMLALLAERVGTAGCLPTWPEIAATDDAMLRACQLGFRARYIKATADFLAARPGWLDETAAAPYAVAKTRLCTLPGVGEKVADCVLLFGAGRIEAFPVDTWIVKAMARHYGLAGWTPAQVAHFGRVHFGSAAGLAQQYLFAWERAHGARHAKSAA